MCPALTHMTRRLLLSPLLLFFFFNKTFKVTHEIRHVLILRLNTFSPVWLNDERNERIWATVTQTQTQAARFNRVCRNMFLLKKKNTLKLVSHHQTKLASTLLIIVNMPILLHSCQLPVAAQFCSFQWNAVVNFSADTHEKAWCSLSMPSSPFG